MRPPRSIATAGVLSLGLVATASAQTPSGIEPSPGFREPIEPWMERITPGGRDIGVLSESLRQAPLEFAFPIGFRGIYQVRGRDELFVRQSGAVYGLFPRSEYILTKKGVSAVWPAGTAFYIGVPPNKVIGLPEPDPFVFRPGEVDARAAQGRVQTRTDQRVHAEVGHDPSSRLPATGSVRSMNPTAEQPPCVLPRFMADESYRRAVLAGLVEGARAEAAPPDATEASASPDRQP